MGKKTLLTRDRLERALRMCKCAKDACVMLGCSTVTLKRRLEQEGLVAPWRKGAPSAFTQQARRN